MRTAWMRMAMWAWAALVVACGGAPKAPSELDRARARYQRAIEPRAEERAAKENLLEVLGQERALLAETAERALRDAKAAEEEKCRLDPTGCTLEVAGALVALDQEQAAERVRLRISGWSADGSSIQLLPGSADWPTWSNASRVLVYDRDGARAVTITREQVGPLPACITVDAEGHWVREPQCHSVDVSPPIEEY